MTDRTLSDDLGYTLKVGAVAVALGTALGLGAVWLGYHMGYQQAVNDTRPPVPATICDTAWDEEGEITYADCREVSG